MAWAVALNGNSGGQSIDLILPVANGRLHCHIGTVVRDATWGMLGTRHRSSVPPREREGNIINAARSAGEQPGSRPDPQLGRVDP